MKWMILILLSVSIAFSLVMIGFDEQPDKEFDNLRRDLELYGKYGRWLSNFYVVEPISQQASSKILPKIAIVIPTIRKNISTNKRLYELEEWRHYLVEQLLRDGWVVTENLEEVLTMPRGIIWVSGVDLQSVDKLNKLNHPVVWVVFWPYFLEVIIRAEQLTLKEVGEEDWKELKIALEKSKRTALQAAKEFLEISNLLDFLQIILSPSEGIIEEKREEERKKEDRKRPERRWELARSSFERNFGKEGE